MVLSLIGQMGDPETVGRLLGAREWGLLLAFLAAFFVYAWRVSLLMERMNREHRESLLRVLDSLADTTATSAEALFKVRQAVTELRLDVQSIRRDGE